jgi:thiol-disulfide isomerase/thioredoxin
VEFSGLYLALGLFALTLIAGIFYKLSAGSGRSIQKSEVIDLDQIGAHKNGYPVTEPGKSATLLQFSTEYCGQCPAVRRSLAQIEYRTGGVLHAEVDLTDRLDLAAKFKISQTPTVFVLNGKGEVTFRVSGVPKQGIIQQELAKLGIK